MLTPLRLSKLVTSQLFWRSAPHFSFLLCRIRLRKPLLKRSHPHTRSFSVVQQDFSNRLLAVRHSRFDTRGELLAAPISVPRLYRQIFGLRAQRNDPADHLSADSDVQTLSFPNLRDVFADMSFQFSQPDTFRL